MRTTLKGLWTVLFVLVMVAGPAGFTFFVAADVIDAAKAGVVGGLLGVLVTAGFKELRARAALKQAQQNRDRPFIWGPDGSTKIYLGDE